MIKKALPYSLLVLIVFLLISELFLIISPLILYSLEVLFLILSVLSIFLYRKEIASKFHDKGKGKFPYWLLLIVVLVLFLFIKLPSFEHTLKEDMLTKYQEYVEPAQHMLESGNLNEFQYHYLTNPLSPGPIKTINHLPIYEYGLLLTYKLLPFNSLEFNTHLFTFLIGCILLISIYIFSNTLFPKPFSIILILVLALSPIVNYASFLPVGDTPMLAFLFFSLFILQKFQKNNSKTNFFIASLLFALGILTKVSVVVVSIPIFLFFFLGNQKEKSKSGAEFIIFLILTIFNVGICLLFLRNYMSHFIISLLGLIVGIAIIFYIFTKINLQKNVIQTIIRKLGKNTFTKYLSWAILALLIAVIYYYNHDYSMGEIALANSFSIFNLELYSTLVKGIIKDLTPEVFFSALAGILALFVIKADSKIKNILLAFLVSAAIYFILLARTILVHDYYQLEIIIAFCVFFTYFVFSLTKIFKNKITGTIFVILLITFCLAPLVFQFQQVIGPDTNDTKLAAEYLSSVMSPNDYFIAEGPAHTLSLYSERNRVVFQSLRTNEVYKEVNELGFSKTMAKLNITYLVTTNPQVTYPYTQELIDHAAIAKPSRDVLLTRYIEHKMNPNVNGTTSLSLKRHFIPVKKVEKYYFFKIV